MCVAHEDRKRSSVSVGYRFTVEVIHQLADRPWSLTRGREPNLSWKSAPVKEVYTMDKTVKDG